MEVDRAADERLLQSAILSLLREHWQLGSLRSADEVAGPTHPLLWGES